MFFEVFIIKRDDCCACEGVELLVGYETQVGVEVDQPQCVEIVWYALEGWRQVGELFCSWLFPCKVHVEEDVLSDPCVVTVFYWAWELRFEEFVACKHTTYGRYLCLHNGVEFFGTKTHYCVSGFICETEKTVDFVCPVIVELFDAVSANAGAFD